MSEVWGRYTALARDLDETRAVERSRTEGLRVGVAEMSSHADELERRLEHQKEGLVALSQHLRLRMPGTAPVEPEGHVDPATDLATLAGKIDEADRQANSAAERGVRPSLLPGLPPFGRALVVYGSAALLVILAQLVGFLRGGSNTSAPLVLFFIPLICFFAAYTTIKIGGRTRVSDARPKLYTRFGLLLCFLVGPLVLVVVALAFPRFR